MATFAAMLRGAAPCAQIGLVGLLSGCCDPDYTPVERDDWLVSTPTAQGLDTDAVDDLYCRASRRSTLFGLLVVKNGHLVAEQYFNAGSIDEQGNRQSVAKSFTGAAVGLAIERGCLAGVDETMMSHFPELVDELDDDRKLDITIEQMLQMRAGYPWEESDDALFDVLFSGDYVRRIAEIPLAAEPGTKHIYSNLTAHWLGVIVSRACGTDLRAFLEDNLLEPLGATVGEDWPQDVDGYHWAGGAMRITARDMAKFGQLYLDDGEWDGEQVISAEWVEASLTSYSGHPGPQDLPTWRFEDYGYGYQWWSARAGDHHVDFAWGHGGNYIFVVDDLDMVVVVTADPFEDEFSGKSWRKEKRLLNMVGRFIESL